MEYVYLSLVVFLFLLAISDLVVGVSNDAVNFLNSAIGSKVAPFKVIMFIAALGILVGATFSSGMMEVARKGIMHPSQFYFTEIMVIFLAVMITDVLLLDLFNTFGFPTSTTVSIVFELLGAAVAVALLKIASQPGAEAVMSDYINSAKALAIISGILLSVVIAFGVGAIVQYFSRLLFSFNYKKTLKRYGSLYGGIAITAITYFILIKGAKGASFMHPSTKEFISQNTYYILGLSFILWTIVLQAMVFLFRTNILKVIVLVGTFALAMAFAGNDLVNFIGVPLAGLASYQDFVSVPGADGDTYLMTALQGAVKTPTFLLLLAGLIMVLTLWFNKKARSVVKTTLDLSRQDEGGERFGSTAISRSLVRGSVKSSTFFKIIIPKSLQLKIESRFIPAPVNSSIAVADQPSFDLVRASVNLVVASVLISFATSLKLPLSTTYVTFMVAMGTSLSDRAWGRESAVYRITGVISVIAGWFFTAFSAFTVAFLMAMLFSWGGIYAISIMFALAAFIIIRTQAFHKKKENASKAEELDEVTDDNILEKSKERITKNLNGVNKAFNDTISGLCQENLKGLKATQKNVNELNKASKKLKDKVHKTLKELKEDTIDTGHFYVQILDYLREIDHAVTFIVTPSLEHVSNNHKGMIKVQMEELAQIKDGVSNFINEVIALINNNNFEVIDGIQARQQIVLDFIELCNKNQIKRIKKAETGTKNSMLFFNLLHETKNLLLLSGNLVKSYRDFVIFDTEKNNTSKK
jgi:phosphate/sulfate permease